MATAGEKVTCLVGVFGGVGVLSASVSTIAFFHGLRVGVYVGGVGVGVCACVGVGVYVGVSFGKF